MYEYAWSVPPPSLRSKTGNPHPYMLVPVLWALPNGYSDFAEVIVDEIGTNGAMRPCLHTQSANAFFAESGDHRFPLGWGGNAYVSNITATQINSTHSLRAAPTIDMNAYAEQALAFMLPKLNENTSLVNSLLELKDLKFSNPTGSLRRIFAKRPALQALNGPNRLKFIKELTTRLNSAVLNATFGIVPFVKDVVGIYDDLTGLAVKLDKLIKNVGKRQQRHYKRVIPESEGVPASRDWKIATSDNTIAWRSGLKSDNSDNGGVRRDISLYRRSRWIKRPVYHATVRYTYTLPEVESKLASIYAYLDVLGVRLDPSIVWNAIPFSFVIDWVVDVGSWLGQFARDNFPIDVQIQDMCHSYSWHLESEVFCYYVNDLNLNNNSSFTGQLNPGLMKVYFGTRKHYNRLLANPPAIQAIRLKEIKLKHAALSLSLLLTKTSWGSATDYLRR
jgi:hypothetical protein